MDSLSPQVASAAKLPILNPNEFDLWKMRLEQYFLMTDYSLWEVILNGDYPASTRVVEGVVQPVGHTSVEQKLARRNELKARGTLLMALPDKHQLKFNSHKDAKTLMEAIKKLQKLVSQLDIHGVSLSQEDVNLNQSTSPQLDNEDLKQIDVDDLEETDLKWQMAILTMRARRFLQKTGRNLGDNEPTSMGFDISKVECYNYHKKGHFARKCRSSKDSRRSKSYDWSYQAEKEPANFALTAFSSSSSSSDNEVPSCLKACLKAYAQLHTQYDKLTDDFRKSQFDVLSYQAGLESIKGRLVVYKQNESIFEENIKLLNIKVQLRDTALVTLRQKVEKAEQERDDLKLKLEKFQTSSKNLTELLQPSGGYHVVPPPYIGTFMPPKPDFVFHIAPTLVKTDHLAFNTKSPQIAYSFAQSTEQVKPPRHSVQPVETSIPATTPNQTSLKTNSSGKRRSRKTCFVCKSVDHLIKDCDHHAKKIAQPTPRNYAHMCNNKQNASMTHKNPQKHMVPAAVLTQSKPVSITVVRPVSAAMPKIMVTRPRHAHPTITKSKSPIRRHKTHSPSLKTSNSPPKVLLLRLQWLVLLRGNLRYALNDKGVIDSGCSRHMTGNMSYLSDFEELNGGYVTFGGNPKGGKNSRKCKIKSRFTWMFFLATKDETSPIFKTFFTGLEHQLSLKAEAVNTACYVQNKVLVTKPNNKTPYELLHGRTPSIGFMRPFGCHVTILNTRDSLGKCEGKVDEGFLVGYSVNNKAFRVFNNRTRIIQETLHLNFLENKPNVAELEDIIYSDDEDAIGAEADFNNLETSITVLVDLPRGKSTKWVYRNKKDEIGIVIRNKARLVAQGHSQEEGIDYKEVFAPVAKIESIRLFLAYASFMGFIVYQMDVKSAFLYGTIEEEVYVCQHPGFEDPNHLDKVYKVVKALYDLHQAPRACQDKYVDEILRKFGLIEGKSASTLIDTEKPLLKDPNGEDVDIHIYRLMIGYSIYLTSSRLEIMFASMSAKRTSWNEFSLAMASAVICLSTEEHVKDVTAGDAAQGDDIAAHREVPTVSQEPYIPSPTPPTPSPQPPQDLPSTSQERQAESQAEIYKIDMNHLSKVLSMQEVEPTEVQEVVDVVTTAKLITEVVTASSETVTTASTIISATKPQVPAIIITDAPARVAAGHSKRRKGVVIRDPEEESTTSSIIPADTKFKDNGKRIMVEEPKPLKKKQQIEMDEEYARKLHAGFNKDIDWDVAIDHMEEEENRELQSINETPVQKAAKRRKLSKEVEDLKRHLEIMADEDDDVYTEATLLARKNFDREDLEALWSLVKERFSTSKPKNFFDDFLLTTLGAMFEKPDGQAQV
uniref:Retrotransposon protein, putative, Ty1-copia subclass n=1 Tax=Tanacetum cinerariifolium TaxID=118510 RepID=A0A6L2LM72_TANCI|nr:retrotransposon protein, putative, Ty1-copia subclass [Tanacetum cinerariifolium]